MKLTFTSGLAAIAAIGALTATAGAQTFTGAGGAIPDFAAGTYNNVTASTNTSFLSTTIIADIPVNSVNQVRLTGWTHTWLGDMQIVLVDPTGVGHNLSTRLGFTGTGFGNSGDPTGTPHGFVTAGLPQPDTTVATNMPAGVYTEHFGNAAYPWTAGNTINGMVVNNGLAGIAPVASCGSTWTLMIFDWAGGDTGSITGWAMDVNGPFTPPVAYCTGKVNSAGCTPAISSTGNMSATCTQGFVLSANNELNNKVGLVLYSEFGRDASAFGPGGILCVKAPTRRSKGFNSCGSPAPVIDFSGVFAIDFNSFGRGLLGTPPNPAAYLSLPGQMVNAQFWGRDPGIPVPNNFSLSNGLEFFVGP